jgi:hypothetical protein
VKGKEGDLPESSLGSCRIMTVSRHREAGFGKIAIHILSVQQDTDVSLPGTYARRIVRR